MWIASNAYDDLPWVNKLVNYVQHIPRDEKAPKVVGICFGHQIIGRAYNAKVSKSARGWEVRKIKIQKLLVIACAKLQEYNKLMPSTSS